MTSRLLATALAAANLATAFPWVALQPGVDSSLLRAKPLEARQTTCPFNPVHPGAVPYNPAFPYNGAVNGSRATGNGGYQVPAPGDTAHYFQAPGPNDIRGPCPGLNAAANHGFLSRDGITTFNELLDAQQNLYNTGYDLAVLLAVAGVGLDGDIVTGKLSLGCDATSRTAAAGGVLGDELGLDGHNKFEGDTSLTRDDYFLGNGDNHSFNGTLFGMMMSTCAGNCSLDQLALYRSQRYAQSRATNPHFFFGPGSLLLYGAASFLYEFFPNFDPSAANYGVPDEATMMSFFGANKNADGTYSFNNAEQIPANWYNRKGGNTVTEQIVRMYGLYPVPFGGNAGVGNFNAMNYSTYISNGQLNVNSAADVTCLLYQLATAGTPSSLSTLDPLPVETALWAASMLDPIFANAGCGRDPNVGSGYTGGGSG